MFLLGCALTEIRLYNTQPHDVTELKCYEIFRFLGRSRFRKVTYFAKSAGNRCAATGLSLPFLKSAFLKCHIDKSEKLEYTVIRSFLRCFRKVRYFAKIFMPFSGWKKDAERRPFFAYLQGIVPFRGQLAVRGQGFLSCSPVTQTKRRPAAGV